MKTKDSISLAINIIYAVILLLFFMDLYTSIEIKNQGLKSFVYDGMVAGALITLICNALLLSKKFKAIGIIIPLVVIVHLIACNPLIILFNSASWKTETIEYKSNDGNKFIEHQMQDRGGCGYSKRTVEVRYITPLFMVVDTPPENYKNNPDWIKANREINELELKYP